MSKKIVTLQDYLDGKVKEENDMINKTLNEEESEKNKKTNKTVAIIALFLAIVTAIGFIMGFKNKNKKNPNEETTTVTTQVPISSMDDLGKQEEFPTNSQYGNTTGDVKKENIVEKDGKYYDSQESADKADKVGQTNVDTQNGKLEVKPDGTVVDKQPGYEVKDETGNVVDKGNNEEDFMKDKITLTENYYYEDGSLAFEKGTILTKTDFEKWKRVLYTKDELQKLSVKPSTKPESTTQPSTKPESTTQPSTKPEEQTKPTTPSTNVSSQGIVNNDGTYTIYGTTYMDKATFEAFILDENSEANFAIYNGVIYPKQNLNVKTK